MRKLAVVVGINDYPGSGADLQGCVNDAMNWTRLLENEGYQVVTLLNEQAAKGNVLAALRVAVASLRFGDRLVFVYSGHGSYIPDYDGDEADVRDEVLCLYDYQSGGLLSDDEMYQLFQSRRWGSRITVLSDSCFSGTMARGVGSAGAPKFMPPQSFLTGDMLRRVEQFEPLARDGRPRSGTVLISGCSENEYSYDAWIDNQAQGAFSANAIKTYYRGIRMGAWFKAIRTKLPDGNYPQSPMLTATSWQRYWSF